MRLICTITATERENPSAFSYYLTSQGIKNECEESPQGKEQYRIWVYDEDQVEQAQALYREYQANPTDSRYQTKIRGHADRGAPASDEEQPVPRRRRILSPSPYGPISIVVLFLTVSLFLLSLLQRGHLTPPAIPGVIQAPTLSTLETALIYDYPLYFQLRDRLLKVYTPIEIERQNPPSPEARKILQEMRQTPVWMGIYERIVNHFKNGNYPLAYKGPLFEKIGEGQVWRLFTPALLHLDLLHIFFNLIWFILLGNQIEYRMGSFRYLIFILLTGIVSNTAQYLMSGPFFMGLSGIVVGMAAFIWARQQVAPWEGYLLQRFTLIFLAIFVVGMFLLQFIFFFLQLTSGFESSITIANSAHIAGGLLGYLLGRLRFFALQQRVKS